jgi:glucose uptake protein
MQEKIAGTVMIVLAGFVNGSSLVPIKFAPTEAQGIQYMISFGIGVLIITPLLNFIYFGIIRREIPNFHYKTWVIPTFASISGLMWNVGNFSSVFATLLLGFTIGFPLTQLSLVVQALFGIVLFKEVTGKLEIIFYAIGVALILAGAFMLGSFA